MRTKRVLYIIFINIFFIILSEIPSECRPPGCTWHRYRHRGGRVCATPVMPSPSHGGCLYAIDAGAAGHVEVLLKDTVLRCWFTGTQQERGGSFNVSDEEIALSVQAGPEQQKGLILKSKKRGKSRKRQMPFYYFEGQADWLKDINGFEASGSVTVNGEKRPLFFRYKPYDSHDG